MNYINNDCLIGMADMLDNSVDLTITSPPDMDEVELYGQDYLDFISKVFTECSRVTKDNGFMVVINTDRKLDSLIEPKHILFHDIMSKLNFKIKDYKIFAKDYVGKVDLYRLTYSHIVVYTKKGKIPNVTQEYRPGVWVFKMPKNKNQFPQELAEKLITALSKETDTVFDPFVGRGTTIAASTKLNRIGVGFEIDTEIYADGLDYLKEVGK